MWPFRRQDAAPLKTKSASFLLGVPVGRGIPTNARYDLLAKEGYTQNCVAFACINRIASAIASVEPQLYKRTGTKLDKIAQHPLLDLLESPNAAQSGKEFLQQLVTHRLTGGNAFVLGTELTPKQVKELYLLHPGYVTVKPGKGIFPEKYEYKPSGEVITYPVDPLTGRSQVMHLKSVNPLDPWVGLSPMLPAAFAIDIHNEGQQWNRRLLENDARPSGALIMKGQDGNPATLTDEQYNRLKADIDQQYSGSQNAGRPMLLEGGLDWKEMSLSAKDMDFLEAKNSAANDIGLVFGVPPQLLGIPGSNTFANYEQANLSFWTDTVIPQLSLILEGFNRWLTPLYGDDLYLWYDENAIDALEPLRKAKADRLRLSDSWSVNEKRKAMGQDDIDGGDVVLVPSTSVPLDLAGMSLSEPGSTADASANAGAE